MSIPGFTAATALNRSSRHFRMMTLPSANLGVIAQTTRACGFQAGRLAGRCLAAGNSDLDCAALAGAYIEFCNAADIPAGDFDVPDSGQKP